MGGELVAAGAPTFLTAAYRHNGQIAGRVATLACLKPDRVEHDCPYPGIKVDDELGIGTAGSSPGGRGRRECVDIACPGQSQRCRRPRALFLALDEARIWRANAGG